VAVVNEGEGFSALWGQRRGVRQADILRCLDEALAAGDAREAAAAYLHAHDRRRADELVAPRAHLVDILLNEPRRALAPVLGDALRLLGHAPALGLVVDAAGDVHVVRTVHRDGDAMVDVLSIACGDVLHSELVDPLPRPPAHTWATQRRCLACEEAVPPSPEHPGARAMDEAVERSRGRLDADLTQRQWRSVYELTDHAHEVLRLGVVDALVRAVLDEPESVVRNVLAADAYAAHLEQLRVVEPAATGLSSVLDRDTWAELIDTLVADLSEDPPDTSLLAPEVLACVAEGVRARTDRST
jgi:hypothetical protein